MHGEIMHIDGTAGAQRTHHHFCVLNQPNQKLQQVVFRYGLLACQQTTGGGKRLVVCRPVRAPPRNGFAFRKGMNQSVLVESCRAVLASLRWLAAPSRMNSAGT